MQKPKYQVVSVAGIQAFVRLSYAWRELGQTPVHAAEHIQCADGDCRSCCMCNPSSCVCKADNREYDAQRAKFDQWCKALRAHTGMGLQEASRAYVALLAGASPAAMVARREARRALQTESIELHAFGDRWREYPRARLVGGPKPKEPSFGSPAVITALQAARNTGVQVTP